MKKISKTKIYLSVICTLLLIIGVAIYNYSNTSNKQSQDLQEVFIHAKINEYTTLAEVERDADVIVYGEKISEEEPTIHRTENGDLGAIYTLSEFRVTEVVEGNVEEGVDITILENQGYDVETNTVYHISRIY